MPRQLPAPPRWLVGRDRELAALDEAAVDKATALNATADGALTVVAIGGAGGVGKTTLALRWAHSNIDRFPDGQLYVNLRGFDPSDAPMPPMAAVRHLLGGLGIGAASLPADEEGQVTLYRSLVAGKRLLVILDNGRDTAQVEPLLPASETCTVLITSRNHLAGLGMRGARLLNLAMLGDTDARDLLACHLGTAPGPDIGLPALSSLTGLSSSRVHAVLRVLVASHLLQEHVPGRYRMHDLLRLYAGELLDEDPQSAAFRRLMDFYLHSASGAARLIRPERRPIDLPQVDCEPQTFQHRAAATLWFDLEHSCLLAGVKSCAATYCEQALVLCRQHDHPRGEAITLDSLGYIARQLGHREGALKYYGDACHAVSQYTEARRAWQRAHDLCLAQHRTRNADDLSRKLAALPESEHVPAAIQFPARHLSSCIPPRS